MVSDAKMLSSPAARVTSRTRPILPEMGLPAKHTPELPAPQTGRGETAQPDHLFLAGNGDGDDRPAAPLGGRNFALLEQLLDLSGSTGVPRPKAVSRTPVAHTQPIRQAGRVVSLAGMFWRNRAHNGPEHRPCLRHRNFAGKGQEVGKVLILSWLAGFWRFEAKSISAPHYAPAIRQHGLLLSAWR